MPARLPRSTPQCTQAQTSKVKRLEDWAESLRPGGSGYFLKSWGNAQVLQSAGTIGSVFRESLIRGSG
ncbi:hypothetical protein MHYP_G00294740 [Metynnis hypsauchen]